jgi:hypothetical protein
VLSAAVTSHHAQALANLMRHVVTTVVVLAVKVVAVLVAVTTEAALTLAAITALLQRLRVVLMTVLHAGHVLCLKVNAHRLIKKLRALNQVAVSHLAAVVLTQRNVPPSRNLIVNQSI